MAQKQPPRRPTPRVAVRIVGILIGVLCGLVLAELALRVLHVEPQRLISKQWLKDLKDPLVNYQCYAGNPHGELGPAPDVSKGEWQLYNFLVPPQKIPIERLRDTPFCVEYRRSQVGPDVKVRGAYPESPPPGTQRILAIGDSFVFGEGVPADRTLPRQMQGLLGAGYEIVNAGKVGADTDKEVRILGDLFRRMHADRAVVVWIANDVRLSRELANQQDFINDLINVRDSYLDKYQAHAWYMGRSRLLRVVGASLAMQRIKARTIQWYLDSYDPEKNPEGLAELEEKIQELGHMPGCKVAFVLFPLLEDLDSYPLASIHEKVAGMARQAGLPVLDLTPAFRGQKAGDLWVHPSDHHPNSKADAIAARAIVEWLRRDVPGFLASQGPAR